MTTPRPPRRMLPRTTSRAAPKTLTAMLCLLANMPFPAVADSPPTTRWQPSPQSMSRLIVGSLPMPSGPPRLIVGIEIHVERGWKTYWRHPGDAGGIPPRLDWSKSQNLKSANVLYPTPERITDAAGTIIGYREHVIFPVEIEAIDPSRPVRLALAMEFGVCSQICNLAEAYHTLTVRTTKPFAMPPPLYHALDRVPRPETALRPADPRLMSVSTTLDGKQPRIAYEAASPNGSPKVLDLFVESLSGENLPIPRRKKADKPGTTRFETIVPLDIDPKSLRNRQLRITVISAAGASEYLRTLQ